MKIAILEDERDYSALLTKYLERYGQETGNEFEISCFRTAEKMLEDYRAIYSIALLDIELPGIDGMEAARRLREVDDKVIIIFITNMAQFAIKGYEVGALDFVVKPLSYADFRVKIGRAVTKAGNNEDREVCVPVVGGFKRLSSRRLTYVEVMGHRLIYHLDDETLETRSTMREAEKALVGCNFIKCNSCYLINPVYIESVKGLAVRVGGDELKISKSKRKKFMTEWTAWVAGESHGRA